MQFRFKEPLLSKYFEKFIYKNLKFKKNESSDKHIEYEIKKHSEYSLTDSGKLIVENGDPAFELYSQLPTEPVLKSEFVVIFCYFKYS